MKDDLLPLVLMFGLAGVLLWLYLRKQPTAPAPCGIPISAYGAGTVVPCSAVKQTLAAVADTAGGILPNLLPDRVKRDVVASGVASLNKGRDPLATSALMATAPAYTGVRAVAEGARVSPLNASVSGGVAAWNYVKSLF